MLHRAGVNPPSPLPSPGLFQGSVLPASPPGMDWDVRSHFTPLMAFSSIHCSCDHNWDGNKISNAAAAVDRS